MGLAEATAQLNAVADGGDVGAVVLALREMLPEIAGQMERDGESQELLGMWGMSANADASDPGTPTVHPVLLAGIGELVGIDMKGEEVHAGVMHTYGYLLSNLETPFGFKRERYTQPVVENGLGLAKGSLSPRPKEGTLLANLTYVAGKVAFGDEVDVGGVRESLVNTPAKFGDRFLLRETVLEADGVVLDEPVELRTELVEFGGDVRGKDTHWLVYSVWEGERGKLITAFPVGRWMVKKLARQGGKDGEIRGRYNVRLGELEGKTLVGERDWIGDC